MTAEATVCSDVPLLGNLEDSEEVKRYEDKYAGEFTL